MVTKAADLVTQGMAERELRAFELRMEDFFRQWAPDDEREKSEFHAQLVMLVRQVYVDAQKPAFDELHRLISALPFPGLSK